MTRHATIDRFEGDIAVLDVDGAQVRRPRASLDPEAREGDVVDLGTGRVDAQRTRQLREELAEARRRLEARRERTDKL